MRSLHDRDNSRTSNPKCDSQTEELVKGPIAFDTPTDLLGIACIEQDLAAAARQDMPTRN